jgi:hypothetical protein
LGYVDRIIGEFVHSSKDKPNELVKVLDKNGKQIFDIKYSHTWDSIDKNDKDTVLGMIKELKIWR